MMSLRVPRSCRSVSSRILNGTCASVCGSDWITDMVLKNTTAGTAGGVGCPRLRRRYVLIPCFLLRRNEDWIAGNVVDDGGPRQHVAASRDDFDFHAAVDN